MNPAFFNTSRPIDSIIQFTNRHLLLSEDKKGVFIEDLAEFLSITAFQDKEIVFDQAFAERFEKYDLPNLFEVMTQLKVAVKSGRFLQITANLSKVANGSLLPREAPNCYQIRVMNTDLWGWIPKDYVEQSEDLKKHLDPSTNILTFEELSPSILYGIQRLASIDETSAELDISLEVFVELCVFALKMESTPLMVDLLVICGPIIGNKKIQNELEALDESFLQTLDRMCDAAAPHQEVISKRASEKSLVRHSEESEGSRWFDPSTPYQSLICFTGRCCTLSMEDQNRFFSAVRHFFTVNAYHNRTISIPDSLRGRIFQVDLPFLLKSMQFVNIYEKRRMLTCMQVVTKLQIPGDVLVASNRYGHKHTPNGERIGWIQGSHDAASNSEGFLPYMELPIRSEEFYDFFGMITNRSLYHASLDELFQLLQHTIAHNIQPLRDSVYLRIKDLCEDPEMRQQMIDRLTPCLHDKEQQDICHQLKLYPFIPSDQASLSEDQVYTVFMFNIEHCLHMSDAIERCLQGTPHLLGVLAKAKESLDDEGKSQIGTYCYNKALALIPCFKRDYNRYPQRQLVEEMLNRTRSEYSRTPERVKESVEFYVKLYKLQDSDIPRIFDALSSEQAVQYWKLADRYDEIELLKKGCIAVQPALLEKTLTLLCMGTFFPELVGQDSTAEKLIRFLFLEAPRFEEHRYGIWKQFAQSHPLSDADLISYYEIIDGSEFKDWLSEHAPQIKHFHFYYPFYQSYKIKDLMAPFTILEKFKEENPCETDAYQLLRKLCLHPNKLSDPDFLRSLVLSAENVSESAKTLETFLQKYPDLFKEIEKLREFGPQIQSIIQKLLPCSEQLSRIKELLSTTQLTGQYRSLAYDVLACISLYKGELTWHNVFKIEEIHKTGWSTFKFNRIIKELDNEQAKECLNSVYPEMHAHLIASLCNRDKALAHRKEIYQVIDTINESKWLTNAKAAKFLKRTLKALVSSDTSEQKEKALAHRMRMDQLDAVDIQNIKRVLEKEEAVAILSTEKLKEAREFLVTNLRSPAASSSQQSGSSKQSGGDCIIS